jgi:uncharacterized phiE125 gp8 family phage protein
MKTVLKTAPAGQPITTAQVKSYSFNNTTKLDTMIGDLIPAAVSWAEDWTGRRFVNQDWYIYYDLPEFMNKMDLSTLNVTAINEVVYFDKDNTSTEIASTKYRLLEDQIIFDDNEFFNTGDWRKFDTVRIDVTAGYGADSDNMPEDIQSALAQLVTYWAQTGKMAYSRDNYNMIPISTKGKLYKYQKRTTWI